MEAQEDSKTKEWKDISLKIRKEVNMCCERCGQKTGLPGKTLTVHHWDGDGKNNNRNNLVALCQSCHMKMQAKFIKAAGMHEFWCFVDILDKEDKAKIQKGWLSKLKQIKEFNTEK